MPAYSCPKGHTSYEPDFCSECGAKIQGVPLKGPAAGSVVAAGAQLPCPDCGAPRTDTSSNFCEVCGYNFATGAHGNVQFEAVAPAVVTPALGAAPVAVPEEVALDSSPVPKSDPSREWMVEAVIDASLRDADSPEPPAHTPPLTVKLEKTVNLIGRRSEKRAITPEVSLDLDDGVSHRHALITRGEDGSLTLRDIGSANGTRLNGTDIKPLVDTELHDGDQITLGRWTRLTVKAS